MNIRIILPCLTVAFVTLAVGACKRTTDASSTDRRSSASSDGTAADNTGRNKAGHEAQSKGPMDQSNSAVDVKISAAIRRAILDDGTMSVNAQNCKIITDAGVVTLRGPVDSQAERDAIEAKAKSVAGVTGVVNELEIKTTN